MSGEVELQMQHIVHYDPNAVHPALSALKEVLANVRTAIAGSNTLPKYLDGEGLLSVPFTSEQYAVLNGEVRTLRAVEKLIIDIYPGVIE